MKNAYKYLPAQARKLLNKPIHPETCTTRKMTKEEMRKYKINMTENSSNE